MFDDICLFIAIVNCGNFSLAARALDISQATLSKKISALEILIGSKLINRDSRNFNLTNNGKVFYDRFKHLEEEFKQKLHNVVEKGSTQSVRLLLPSWLANNSINDEIYGVSNSLANIKLQITYSNLLDFELVDSSYDLALISRFTPYLQLQQNIIHSTKNILITNIANMNKIDAQLECLSEMTYVVFGRHHGQQIELNYKDKSISFTPRIMIYIDNIGEIKQYLMNPSIIAIIPEHIVAKQFSRDEIKPVLTEYYCGYTQYELHYNKDQLFATKAVAILLDKIVRRLKVALFN